MISTGGEGKVSAHKRLRGKIGNPNKSNELKQYNLFDDTADASEFYAHEKVYGVYISETDTETAGVWRPLRTYWPSPSVLVGGRIGKRICVRYLRIKGYVAASPFLITQVRWRLVLYRVRKNLVNGAEVYNQAWLRALYAQYEDPQTFSTSQNIQNAIVQNYYLSYFDPDNLKIHDCKRRVLVKGILKPSADIGNFKSASSQSTLLQFMPTSQFNTDTITGQAAGTIQRAARYNATLARDFDMVGKFQLHNNSADMATAINSKSFFPIDVTVNMNDNVDCWEYTYVFVIESDWGVGQSTAGYFENDAAHSNYFFYFVPQIYYTDD